jgi:hypothetical protein
MKMYCKDHSSLESQKAVKESIEYYKLKSKECEDRLYNINESRKLWLIQEMSGIDEGNNFIQKDSNWKDPTMEDMGESEGE